MCRVGKNRTYTTYMTVHLVISLPKIQYIHRIFIWFWPTLHMCVQSSTLLTILHSRKSRVPRFDTTCKGLANTVHFHYYTLNYRSFGDFPTNILQINRIFIWLWPTLTHVQGWQIPYIYPMYMTVIYLPITL